MRVWLPRQGSLEAVDLDSLGPARPTVVIVILNYDVALPDFAGFGLRSFGCVVAETDWHFVAN